jgi:hypothetical protein
MRTLTVSEFRTFTDDEKCDLVTQAAAYVHFRELGDTVVFLYHINNFFIEIFYSRSRRKNVMINATDRLDCLDDDYLSTISLKDLNKVLNP